MTKEYKLTQIISMLNSEMPVYLYRKKNYKNISDMRLCITDKRYKRTTLVLPCLIKFELI